MKPIRFWLKIEYLWGLTALIGTFVFVNTHPIRPQDFWWHITIGREIATTGKIPKIDVYSYTEAGQPYPSYQMYWLMETVLYEVFRFGGSALVVFVHSLIITSAYAIIFWIAKQISRSWRIAAFSVLFAAALGLNDWNIRPQDITFLLGSLFLLGIYQYRQTTHWPWLIILPLGMILWVNCHGTFVIGLALLGIWFGQELWDFLKHRKNSGTGSKFNPLMISGLTLIVTLLVCLLNPRGFGIIEYVKTLTGNSVVQNLVIEWAAPSLNSLFGIIFYVGLFGCAILLAVSPRRPAFYQLVTLVIFGLLAIKTSRGIIWFGLVMAPILAEHLLSVTSAYFKTEHQPAQTTQRWQVNLIFMAVLLVMGVISLPWFKQYLPLPPAKAGLISAETPVQATQVLLSLNPPGRLFNSMSFGSYLIWAAYPRYQVFVDTRIELFSQKVWMDYLDISNASGAWETSLSDYGVNTLMLSPVEQPALIQAAKLSANWELLYQDNSACIFGRK